MNKNAYVDVKEVSLLLGVSQSKGKALKSLNN